MSADPLEFLFSLEQFGIKFGLDNIRSILAELGYPEQAFRAVHVAGTNGKGSVTAMVDAMLTAAGHRSGRYTSPHLVNLTERFAVDGAPISENRLKEVVARIRETVEALQRRGVLDVHPTFFEVTTASAFEWFRQSAVDVAVCEVGLGGRLDATNVLTPMATAITSIGFDHQQYLGETLSAIAAEKAGIIKPGVPVVVGDIATTPAHVIEEVAREHNAPLIRARDGVSVERVPDGDDVNRIRLRTPRSDYGVLEIGLSGEHQIGNALVAVRIAEEIDRLGVSVPPAAVADGLRRVSWPGRLQRLQLLDGREVLLDAAHNPEGAQALARFLATSEKRPLVFAAMRDKDIRGIAGALAPYVSAFVATRAAHPRSADPADLVGLIHEIAPGMRVSAAESPAQALAVAWRDQCRIVVAGSIFLLGDVLKELGRT